MKLLSYLITPPPSEAYLLALPQILKSHSVDWIMYRDASPMGEVSFELIERFLDIVAPFEKILILNLPFRSAAEIWQIMERFGAYRAVFGEASCGGSGGKTCSGFGGFHGVHLKSHLFALITQLRALEQGKPGRAVSESTRLNSRELLIGYSAHSTDELKAAFEAGASYATLSPIFPSAGKGAPLGLEALAGLTPSQRQRTFALGGIDKSSLPSLQPLGLLGFAAIGYFKP